MSEIDTMFSEQDRRCAAVQHMLSTDPSYDNRTIASTLKMQIRTVQRLRAQLNASDDTLEVVERKPKAEDTTRKNRTKEFIENVQAIIDETHQRPIRQIAKYLGVSHTTANACVKEDLKYRSNKEPQVNQVRQVADLNPLDYFVLPYVENITNMTSHNTKASLIAAIRRVFAELPPALVEKACSKFRIRIEAVIEAEGGYMEQMSDLSKSKVKLATIVEGNPKAPFSIATTPRCRGGRYSFPGLLYFTLDPYLIMLSVKQGGIKYHFLSLWYDSTWDWNQVSRATGEHSNP